MCGWYGGGALNSLKAESQVDIQQIFLISKEILGCLDKFREKVKTANLGGSNFLLVDAI